MKVIQLSETGIKKLEVSDFDKNWASKFAQSQDSNKLLTAAKALIKRMDEIHETPEFKGVWQFYAIHGQSYPSTLNYAEELKHLKEVIQKYESQ